MGQLCLFSAIISRSFQLLCLWVEFILLFFFRYGRNGTNIALPLVKQIKVLKEGKDDTLCKVVVCEGKKRHLRRLFKALGFSVKGLRRVRVGGLMLGGLREGMLRALDRERIYSLVFKKR